MSFDRGTVGIYAAGAYHRIRNPADPGEKGGSIDGAGENHRDHITLRGNHGGDSMLYAPACDVKNT